jgi:hypothetical protein
MAPVTNQMLNAKREENCVSITTERKYFRVGQSWIKRSLRPSEWQINQYSGTLLVPRFGKERVFNEASAIEFIAKTTNIPVPRVVASRTTRPPAGFYPQEFEGMFFRRPGPSVALEGEVNDEDRLLNIMIENEMR